MKKLFAAFFILCSASYAVAASLPQFAPVTWLSHNTADEITIANETTRAKQILISVAAVVEGNKPGSGILIKNCGANSSVKAGNSVICDLLSKSNIMFHSDSQAGGPAGGIYQVEQ